ncbi:hypothetical protein [Nostocoides jenkinsii]|uniref:Uncharacterized protein n=1 Tax=Nostocoides jenkinsii Ben 74 TaxID=1193518 RepID=A0A077M9U0_9MICO|nr:hypothetical protein [Tetrasphaera jenkinsii]CCI54131.1 hypothetical protein BN13_60032 [Tetrasphaera jenkinsii Ben 74]
MDGGIGRGGRIGRLYGGSGRLDEFDRAGNEHQCEHVDRWWLDRYVHLWHFHDWYLHLWHVYLWHVYLWHLHLGQAHFWHALDVRFVQHHEPEPEQHLAQPEADSDVNDDSTDNPDQAPVDRLEHDEVG